MTAPTPVPLFAQIGFASNCAVFKKLRNAGFSFAADQMTPNGTMSARTVSGRSTSPGTLTAVHAAEISVMPWLRSRVGANGVPEAKLLLKRIMTGISCFRNSHGFWRASPVSSAFIRACSPRRRTTRPTETRRFVRYSPRTPHGRSRGLPLSISIGLNRPSKEGDLRNAKDGKYPNQADNPAPPIARDGANGRQHYL